ncbi:Hypothetical predicted protein [Podarcis lilfordi]|uniref:Uncharacterized protein n=1 Tax=Podarcis lilfordi TaxID=74358 RepID=A0AA35LNF1_9SAUR|nr:Hypothetical predicted protein [Podarcis lilfordi]
MPSAATPDMISDTQVVPESPSLTQVDDLPGTSAALFNDSQFSGADPSSWTVTAAVQTRSRAHSASSGPQNRIGSPARRPPACVNNPVASSSSSPSQNKQPRVQLPELGTSSAGEEEQQLEGGLQTAEGDKPSGKRRTKKKHVCKKSKLKTGNTDEESEQPVCLLGGRHH